MTGADRWKETRKWFPGKQFEVFNLVFICFFQHALILGGALGRRSELQHVATTTANRLLHCFIAFSLLCSRPLILGGALGRRSELHNNHSEPFASLLFVFCARDPPRATENSKFW